MQFKILEDYDQQNGNPPPQKTERFMELYDMPPEILVGNKQDKSRADFPTFTMIGASAFELIEQSLAQHFITVGFTNRCEQQCQSVMPLSVEDSSPLL